MCMAGEKAVRRCALEQLEDVRFVDHWGRCAIAIMQDWLLAALLLCICADAVHTLRAPKLVRKAYNAW